MDEFEDTDIHAPQELCAFPLWTCNPSLKGVHADGGLSRQGSFTLSQCLSVLSLLSSTLPSLFGRHSPA
ncbi:hypothetical protein BDN71DRAFT_1454040 [Pleurotus eryngii]|uniref:Uncharacterized protein n=1 Tax=Pleurotus eryngii TaxID=5323 RepID=A0A9P5ZNG8_PLEER|nr:hypothetical protein BDN71DRAFT_1454040 [Pleurotus eryngii]